MKQRIFRHLVPMMIVLFAAFTIAVGIVFGMDEKGSVSETAPTASDRPPEDAQKKAASVALPNFGLSLEKREDVDFLLTPALLVQEILSPEAVITYPNE